jgi:hypothetical protein
MRLTMRNSSEGSDNQSRAPEFGSGRENRYLGVAFLILLFAGVYAIGSRDLHRQEESPRATRTIPPSVRAQIPSATECEVEPRNVEDVLALLDQATPVIDTVIEVQTTPNYQPSVFVSGTPWVVNGQVEIADDQSDVDPTIASDANQLFRELVSCGNGGNVRQMLTLFTDQGIIRTFDRTTLILSSQLPWYPWGLRIDSSPLEPEQRGFFVPGLVVAARLLPDGRAWVIAREERDARWASGPLDERKSYGSGRVYLLRREHGQWRIDQVIDKISFRSK